jgi:hypothetical protein
MSVSDLPPGEFSPGDQAELVRLGSLLTSKDLSTVTLERALDENSLVDRFVSRYAAWQTFSAPVPAGNRAAGPCAIMARDFALVFRLLIRNRVLRNMGVSVVCVKCVFYYFIYLFPRETTVSGEERCFIFLPHSPSAPRLCWPRGHSSQCIMNKMDFYLAYACIFFCPLVQRRGCYDDAKN